MDDLDNAIEQTLKTNDRARMGATTADPLDAAVSNVIDMGRTQQRASLRSAATVNPDEAARANALAAKRNLPPDVVLRNLPEVQRQDTVENADAILATSPALARKMRELPFAQVAHDNVDALAGIENQIKTYGEFRALRGPEPTLGSYLSGVWQSVVSRTKQADIGLSMQVSDLAESLGFGADPVRRQELKRRYAQAQSDASFTEPEFKSDTAKGIYSGVSSTVSMLPATAMSLLARNPTPALFAMGIQTEADAYGKYRARGATPGEALVGGAGEGAVEVLTEKIPMGFLVDKFGKTGAKQFLSGMLLREVPSEQVATLLQDAIDTAVANPEKTWGEYLDERPGAAYQTLLATLVQAGTMGGASAVVQKVAERAQREQQVADQDATALTALLAASEKDKLRERDPQAFAALVQASAEQHGAPADVYIDANALVETLAQSGMTPEQISAALPSTSKTLAEAVAAGGDVTVPIGEFTALVAGSGMETQLSKHARLSPDALSQEDAKLLAKVDLKAETEKVMAEQEVQAESAQVRQQLIEQLNTAGRFSPAVNAAYADSVVALYETQAARLGIPVQEFAQRYPLNVEGFGTEEGPRAFNQNTDAPITGQVLDRTGAPMNLSISRQTYGADAKTTNAVLVELRDPANNERRGFIDFSIGEDGVLRSEVTKVAPALRGRGLAEAMYQAARNAGFDIAPGKVQTEAGQAMVEKLQAKGLINKQTDGRQRAADVAAPLMQSGRLPASPVLNTPRTPTPEEMKEYSRVEEVPLAAVFSTQAKRDFDAFDRGDHPGALIDGYDDKPVAVRREDGVYLLLDGHHRAERAAQAGKTSMPMHVIDAKAHDPENAGRKSADGTAYDSAEIDDLARELGLEQDAKGDSLQQTSVDQTQTPEFKAWFGDSKVVDADGKPMVVYHGTAANFDKFDTVTGSDVGFHFGDAEAANYVGERERTYKVAAPHVMPVYLSISNPLRVADTNFSPFQFARALARQMEDGTAAGIDAKELRDLADSFDVLRGAPGAAGEAAARTIAFLKEKGFDGLVYRNKKEGRADSWVAFKPEQIKSATGNDGTFDANDPSILSQDAKGTFTPSTNTIALLAKADLSTFHHELGHFYLEVLADMAAQPNAPATVVEDMNRVLEWFGIKGTEAAAPIKIGESKAITLKTGEKVTLERIATQGAEDVAGAPGWVYNPEEVDQAIVAKDADGKEIGRLDFVPGSQAIESSVSEIWRRKGVGTALYDAAEASGADIAGGGKRLGTVSESALKLRAARDARSARTPLDTWQAMSLEQQRKHHEKFARGYEAYLFEGKAPSTALSRAFQRFSEWMRSIYKSIRSLNVELDDDIRRVYDRMLASEQAIKEAEAARAYAPLFADEKTIKEAGVDPNAYHALGAEATANAIDQLQARSMRDMRWLANAKGRALKALQKDARATRAVIEAEVTAEVNARPEYRAADLIAEADKEFAADPFSADPGLRRGAIADALGFTSPDAMAKAIEEAPPRDQVIEGKTDQRMLEEHGELSSPDALERAAEEAIRNEARGKFIATEWAASDKAAGPVRVLVKAAKDFAEAVIGRKTLKDIRPHVFVAAETRAARMAEKAMGKSIEDVAMAKRNQTLNHYAARYAYDAREQVKRVSAFFDRVANTPDDKLKSRDLDVVNAARAVLAAYGVGRRGEAAADYLKRVAAYDPDMSQVLQGSVDAAMANAKPMAELTFDELRALNDEVESLWHLAKRSRQMEIDGDLLDREEVQDDLKARLEEIGIPETMPGDTSAVTPAQERMAKFKTYLASARRTEGWVEAMDGKPSGVFRSFVWQPVKEAADSYRADKAAMLKKFRALLVPIAPTMRKQLVAAPELNYTFGKDTGGVAMKEILHAVLHTGNESNKRKLLLGRKWATERPDGTLDTSRWDSFVKRMADEGVLKKEHFDFAQGVWDLLEETKPLAQKTHRDVFGKYFAEITADPVDTPFGQYRGGYVPAQADPRVVTDAQTRKLMEDENASMAFAFPTTNKGFTKSRVEYNRPLMLDLGTISQHIDKVLLFSHMERPIRDVRRVLTSKGVAYGVNRIDPAAFDSIISPWLNRAARQQVTTPSPGHWQSWRLWSTLRNRAGMAAMFGNVVNAAQQITGLSIAAVKVQPKYMLSAAAHYITNPRQMANTVAEASPYMEGRMRNEVSAMNDQIKDILIDPGLYEKAQQWSMRHAYFMQSAVDNVVGPIVWTGAYNQALEQGQSEKEAARFADSTVRQTQGSTLPEDISNWESGSSFSRMFSQFAGYFNTQANLLGTEFQTISRDMGVRKGAGRGLYVTTMAFLVPAWISELIVQAFRGGPDDEDKDGEYLDDWLTAVFGLATLRGATAMIPIFGQGVNAAVNATNSKPYDDRLATSPAISMIEAAVKSPVSVYKAMFEDGDKSKAVKDVASLISLLTGIPANIAARPLSYVADVQEGDVVPTGPGDAARGLVTGRASPDSKR